MAAIEEIRKSVQQLYDFRNNYYDVSTIEKYCEKDNAVESKLQETLKLLNDAKEECEKKERALYCMLYGKALNVKRDYDQLSFELLSKAVKLNPKLTEAWNQLGECYWKKGDLKAAYTCFEGSLKQDSKDKVSLRNQSMLLRQLGDNPKEKHANLLKSLEIAKSTVALDVNDGMSWYNLGNAFFNLFFATSNADVMKQCKKAYSRAILDPVANTQPDFLFNYAVCLQYEESFQESLEYFAKAALLDPCWNEPSDVQLSLQNFIRDINEMIEKKGSLKAKRLQSILVTLKPELHCGPLKNTMKIIAIRELSVGINKDAVLLCKIIAFVNAEKMLCHTFCVIDCEQNCAALSIYNLNAEKGPKIGDSVAVPEPFFRVMKINHDKLNISYRSIRVDNPITLIVNGKHVTQECIAIPRISFIVTSE